MGRFIALFLVTFLYAAGVVSGFVGYLLFAAVATTYIVVGILVEVRDLVDLYCARRYKDRVSMLVPWRSRPR
jgi:protein-S-isoprenylcysteine O-methyltransferase Ste14